LKLKGVIEGVETEDQMNFLSKNFDNPIIQGYYYSKPLHAVEVVDWINTLETQSGAVS
jgi:diguanylate cyclase